MPVSVWGYKCSCKEHQQRIKDFNNPIVDYELVSGVKRQGYRTRDFQDQAEGTIHLKSYPTDYISADFLLRKVQKVHEDFLLCRVFEEIFFLVHLFLQATSRLYRSRFPSSQVHSICIFYYLCLVYKEIFILQHLFLEADCKVQSFIFIHSQCGRECFPPFCSNQVIKCAPPTSFSRILYLFYKNPEIRH